MTAPGSTAVARAVRSTVVRLVAALGVTTVALAGGLAAPAHAADQEIVLTKAVNGPAPSGASYQVQLACQPEGVISGGFVFSGPGTQNVDATGITSCTVSEPGTGGAASVAFRCQATGRGVCASETTLQFLPGDGPASVTITITNTFNPPTTTTTAPTTTTTAPTTTTTAPTTTSSLTTSSSTTILTPATTKPSGTTPGTALSSASTEGGSNLTPAIIVAIIAGVGVVALVIALIVQRRKAAAGPPPPDLDGVGDESTLPGGGSRPDAGPYGPSEPPVDPPAQS